MILKRELLGLKLGWKQHQTVDPPEESPRLVGVLFGIRILILHFKFQFSKSIKSSAFHIFLGLTYPLRTISFSQNFQKLPQKITQNRQTVVNEISIEI